jgi:PBSX family phage terminase large subunit
MDKNARRINLEVVGVVENLIELEYPISLLPKQKEAFDSTKRCRYTTYSGAVGAGKTMFAAHVAIEICLNYPGVKGFLGCLTYTQLKNVLFTTFKEEIYKYEDSLSTNGVPVKLLKRLVTSKGNMEAEFYNGSIIYFIACEKEEKIRGYNLDFFILDEPIEIDELIFTQLMARLRGKKSPRTFGLLTTNPGSEMHWIYKRFYVNKINSPEYNHIDTCTYDNIYLDPSYITDMEQAYDEDWVKRMLQGKWGAYSGQIFKCFTRRRHVGDYKKPFPNDEIKYYVAGVDWGMTNPSSVITYGVTKDNNIRVVHEYRNDNYNEKKKTTNMVSKVIAALHKRYNYRKVWCDPSAKDLIVQTRSLGVPIEKADNDVEGGIGKINSLLQKDRIKIDKSCYHLITEMPSYHRKKDKLNSNKTEEPVKQDDHSIDALRYGLTNFRTFGFTNLLGTVKRSMWEFPT